MKVKPLILLLIILLVLGCASTGKYKPESWVKKPSILDAVDEAQKQSAKKAEEALLIKIQPKPKAKVEMSSVEVVSADWNGIIFKRVGDVKLRFSIREKNGIGVKFDKYHVRVICTYSGILGTSEASRTGTFFFKETLQVQPLELKEVFLDMNTWVSKTANSMDRALKLEEYRIYVTLTGEDDYGNTITIDSESAPL